MRGSGAAKKRADACDELLVCERLHQVVVRAGLEPDDPIANGVAGGEHQDGQSISLGPELLADLDAVATRHHHVEHDEVERA